MSATVFKNGIRIPAPLVDVVYKERFTTPNHPTGTFSYMFKCKGGHWHRRKGSQGVPRRVRCKRCYWHQPKEESCKA